MSTEDLEKALARGLDILKEFLPVGTSLYFPLLYSACVWAWQIWMDPETVKTKPDEFVLGFFASHGALQRAYEKEIGARDLVRLREAFPALYPVCGLEDSFLKALFKPELESGDFRKIVAQFKERAAAARDDILAAGAEPGFWRGLERFGMEAASLGIHLLGDEAVQDLIISLLKKRATAGTDGGT
jgi:hypothetical protein